jgi:hypothetical protein
MHLRFVALLSLEGPAEFFVESIENFSCCNSSTRNRRPTIPRRLLDRCAHDASESGRKDGLRFILKKICGNFPLKPGVLDQEDEIRHPSLRFYSSIRKVRLGSLNPPLGLAPVASTRPALLKSSPLDPAAANLLPKSSPLFTDGKFLSNPLIPQQVCPMAGSTRLCSGFVLPILPDRAPRPPQLTERLLLTCSQRLQRCQCSRSC